MTDSDADGLPDYGVARYLGIDAVSSPSFTDDGALLYLADTTGSPDVWRRPGPDTEPERLTGHDQRVSFVAASPTREEAVFGMDQGSDERDQLFLYDLETGAETDLTRDPDAVHSWGGWGPDGDRFAYAANRRQADTFDVHVQCRDETAADSEVVYEGPGGFLSVAAWGPDGDRLALVNARSSVAQDLYVLDLTTGPDADDPALTQVNADDDATYGGVSFGADGGLYVLTNQPGDHTVLGRFDLDAVAATASADRPTGNDNPALDVVVARDGWNVDDYALDPETGRLAYTVNVDGYTDLTVGELTDPTTVHQLAKPDLAADAVDPAGAAADAGVVAALEWGPDAERLAVTHSASDRPHRALVVDLGPDTMANPDGEPQVDVEAWADYGTLGMPTDAFLAPETIRYETFDGREIPAYWTLPPGVDGDDPEVSVPVIVDIHGGPTHQRRPWFYPTKQFYLRQGYAVLEPNVRGSTGYGKAYTELDDKDLRMDSVADIEAAVEWLHDHPEVDPDRIVAKGGSYGGFMVLAAMTEYPDLWAAGIDIVGIANFVTFLENTGDWRRALREAEYGSLEDDREFLEEISPINNIEHIDAPLYVLHGANDPRVPVGEAEQIAEKAAAQGVPVEKLIFEDEGHGFAKLENQIEAYGSVVEFLDEHV